MANCQFIAFHGWGFDDRHWQNWEKELSKYGSFECYDRGYFGDDKEIKPTDEFETSVLISHSFGLHWIDDALLEQAKLLIITGGFLHFHPYAAQYKRRSRLVLQEMINSMEVNPQKVLNDFYENSYAPQEAPEWKISDFNHQLLIDDLQELKTAELDVQKLKKAQKICILHGSEDRIVPNRKGRQIFTQLQDKSQYFEVKGAGHALPFTHSEQCLNFITPEVEHW